MYKDREDTTVNNSERKQYDIVSINSLYMNKYLYLNHFQVPFCMLHKVNPETSAECSSLREYTVSSYL